MSVKNGFEGHKPENSSPRADTLGDFLFMAFKLKQYTTISKHLATRCLSAKFAKELLLWATIKRDYGRRVSFLKIDELAAQQRVHPKTIRRRLERLVQRGWLTKSNCYYYIKSQAKVLAHEGIILPNRAKAIRLFQGDESVSWLYGALHTLIGSRIKASTNRSNNADGCSIKVSCRLIAKEVGRPHEWVSRMNRKALANKHILYTTNVRNRGELTRDAAEFLGLSGRVFFKDGQCFERLANTVELRRRVLNALGVSTYEYTRWS
jgi:hypothetical protein